MGVVVAIAVAILVAQRGRHHREQHQVPPAVAARVSADTPATPATWTLGSLTLTACELARPNSGLSVPAWCAMFPVPENRTDPHSRISKLKLGILRHSSQVSVHFVTP